MFSISQQSGRRAYGIKEFICDEEIDVSKLPKFCEVGSTAFVISNSTQYMLNNQREWKKVSGYSGGSTPGGGGGSTGPDPDWENMDGPNGGGGSGSGGDPSAPDWGGMDGPGGSGSETDPSQPDWNDQMK